MVAHWSDYADPGYLPFIEAARPEIVQVGFYGAHFWGLADTPFGKGYPAHFPVQGLRECAAWFSRLNGELHRRGAKVIGHLNVKFLVGDLDGPDGPRGFFRFYRRQWDEQVLGVKPVEDPVDLLEKDREGKPISNQNYSTGDAANFTDLAAGLLGEATLQARYIRGAFDDKPFTLGKYESTRIRVAIAELAANGGAPMGFYTRFTDPMAQEEIVRYYSFLRRHDSLFRANRSYAEVLLTFPRKAVHAGNVAAVARFKEIGQRLLAAHVLFDVLPDDLNPSPRTALYSNVVDPTEARQSASWVMQQLPQSRSRFQAPVTVRVSASRPAVGNEIDLHFVNYNREEPPQTRSPGGGIKDERPMAVPGFPVRFRMPAKTRAWRLEFITPEAAEPRVLKSEPSGQELRFEVPSFLVYGVVRIYTKDDA